jgi:hypothetical protein
MINDAVDEGGTIEIPSLGIAIGREKLIEEIIATYGNEIIEVLNKRGYVVIERTILHRHVAQLHELNTMLAELQKEEATD